MAPEAGGFSIDYIRELAGGLASAPPLHVAGEPRGLLQRCARCGYVLVDFQEGGGRVSEAAPLFFTQGRLVEPLGAGAGVRTVEGTITNAAERLCRLAPAGTAGVFY